MTEVIGSPRAIADRWLTTYLLVAGILLAVGVAGGFVLGTQVSSDVLTDLAPDAGTDFEITFGYIFWHNVIAVTMILLGAISLGTFTGFYLLLNGFVIGFVVNLALREIPADTVLLLLAPHGIVEIPAILIVGAIGLRFGHRTVRYLRGHEENLVTVRELTEGFALYLLAMVLIAVAAWIEAKHTLAIADALT